MPPQRHEAARALLLALAAAGFALAALDLDPVRRPSTVERALEGLAAAGCLALALLSVLAGRRG